MEKRLIVIFLVLPILINWHWFEAHAKKNLKGVEAFKQKKYSEALKEFLAARGIKPDMDALKSNTAVTLYQMKKYKEALEELNRIDNKKTTLSKADYFYNMGNTYFRMKQFDKALDSFKKSLIEDGTKLDTKKNYEITLKKIEEQKKKKKEQEDKKNKNKKDQNKKDQNNKKQNQDKDKKQQNNKQQKQNPDKKHKNLMNYLNQNEKKQHKKKKRVAGAVVTREKDW